MDEPTARRALARLAAADAFATWQAFYAQSVARDVAQQGADAGTRLVVLLDLDACGALRGYEFVPAPAADAVSARAMPGAREVAALAAALDPRAGFVAAVAGVAGAGWRGLGLVGAAISRRPAAARTLADVHAADDVFVAWARDAAADATDARWRSDAGIVDAWNASAAGDGAFALASVAHRRGAHTFYADLALAPLPGFTPAAQLAMLATRDVFFMFYSPYAAVPAADEETLLAFLRDRVPRCVMRRRNYFEAAAGTDPATAGIGPVAPPAAFAALPPPATKPTIIAVRRTTPALEAYMRSVGGSVVRGVAAPVPADVARGLGVIVWCPWEGAASARCASPVCVADAADGVPAMCCSRCRQASYCSEACQRAAWPTHKSVCAAP